MFDVETVADVQDNNSSVTHKYASFENSMKWVKKKRRLQLFNNNFVALSKGKRMLPQQNRFNTFPTHYKVFKNKRNAATKISFHVFHCEWHANIYDIWTSIAKRYERFASVFPPKHIKHIIESHIRIFLAIVPKRLKAATPSKWNKRRKKCDGKKWRDPRMKNQPKRYSAKALHTQQAQPSHRVTIFFTETDCLVVLRVECAVYCCGMKCATIVGGKFMSMSLTDLVAFYLPQSFVCCICLVGMWMCSSLIEAVHTARV